MSNKNSITLASYLQSLRSRRAKLDTLIAAIEEEIAESAPFVDIVDTAVEPTINRARHARGPYSDMTIIDACIKFLKSMGTPQTTRAIQAAIWDGGIKSKSNSTSPYRTTYSILNQRHENKSDITKEGSLWGLKEWEEQK